jgi:hypothetical protein
MRFIDYLGFRQLVIDFFKVVWSCIKIVKKVFFNGFTWLPTCIVLITLSVRNTGMYSQKPCPYCGDTIDVIDIVHEESCHFNHTKQVQDVKGELKEMSEASWNLGKTLCADASHYSHSGVVSCECSKKHRIHYIPKHNNYGGHWVRCCRDNCKLEHKWY